MIKQTLFVMTLLTAGSLWAADSNPKDDVVAAAAALGNQPNYSWLTTTDVGNGGRFRPGPVTGKTEKGGYTFLTLKFNDDKIEVAMHGTNAAVNTPDDGWLTAAEASEGSGGGPNPARFAAFMTRNFKAPAEQAATLAGQAKDLAAGTNGIAGTLPEDEAKAMLTFRRGGNGNGPEVSGAKASVVFWLTDGKLTKYQTHVKGTVTFNGNDREVDRTTTTEITAVAATKVEVPDDAKKKLE